MIALMELFQAAVTITGIVVLVMVFVRTSQKEDSPLVILLGMASAICIKVGATCALLMLLMFNYESTSGALTILSIGFYVAVGSILYSLVQAWARTAYFRDFGTVMAHKVNVLQNRLNIMAEDAKRAAAVKKTPPVLPQVG
jgi:hypothetical protein